ncbi:PREDICTED: hybrid signal transduction histidine kinase L-like [Rhagoletis zephyria]|uniref:hybrid signal transduction histidine kinase L-like n=1 Tax=Rhagoletis zephyria TaxID=28612 RepID=UPI000811A829|nr:PREDICTED: hybrid signal transduction histidine kinase L-like [Rhagoletis zephyria]
MSISWNLQNLTQLFWTIIIVLNLYVALLLVRMSKVYRTERRIKLLETANIREQIEFMRSRPDKSVSSNFSHRGSFTTRSRFFEQFLDSEPPQLRSCMRVRSNFRSNSSTTAADEEPDERRDQRVMQEQQQQQQQHLHKRSKQLQMELQRKYDNFQIQQQQQQQYEQRQQHHHHQQSHQMNTKARNRYEHIVKHQQPQQLRNPNAIEQTSSEEAPPYNSKPDDEHTLYISDSFGRVVHEIPFRECDYMDALQVVLGDQRWKIKKAWNESSKTNMRRVN